MNQPAGRATHIPLAYFEGFLDFLAANTDKVRVITYADLAWGPGDTRRNNYLAEWRRWQARLASDPEAASMIHVLIQHDVDGLPEQTMKAVQLESDRGIRSNVMVFARQHHRRRLKDEGIVELTPYELDVDLLRRLEREQGFVVGYHCNAFEQSLWNARAAQRRFREDVRLLRSNFDIRFYSAHGGVPGPEGTNNWQFEPSWWSARGLRWVHNGHRARMTASYTDGGMFGPKRELASRDLRAFVKTWQPGGRYRILTHPQYYGENAVPHARFPAVEWYTKLFGKSPDALWAGVSLPAGRPESPGSDESGRQ